MRTRLFAALLVTVLTVPVVAGDWPTWRGPNRDGVSTETGLLQSWPSGGPKLVYKTSGIGGGMASVAVVDGKVYTCGSGRGGTQLVCLNAKDGSKLWSTQIGGGGDPNCTPTVDAKGEYVIAMTKGGDVLCANAKTGAPVWKKNFGRDFGGKMMSGWGYSESPLIDGDRVILTPGSKSAAMAALDLKTGKTIWTTEANRDLGNKGKDGAGYSSIVISKAAGVKQYVTLTGRGVIGVHAGTGKLLWHYNRVANGTANIPTPIVKGSMVFTSSGYGDGGSAILQITRSGVKELKYFSSRELQNHHGGVVLVGDYIYGGHGHNKGLPFCLAPKTGKVMWLEDDRDLARKKSAAVVYADKRLYFRYEDGTMHLVEASPRGYKLHGSFKIPGSGSPSWPHPVVSDGKLYLRNQDELYVYDVSESKS